MIKRIVNLLTDCIGVTNGLSIPIFFLLYYIYMNPVKSILIPFNTVSIPIILLFVLYKTINQNKKIIFGYSNTRQRLFISWFLISIYIFFHNCNIINGLLNNGMIQLYVMIAFLLFSCDDESWLSTWVSCTKMFVIVYALSTILFYYRSDLYLLYISKMYDADSQIELLKFYDRGWMSGLCGHFSTNGMILSTGLIFYVEDLFSLYKRNRSIIIQILIILLLFYSLILSSKRSPLISSIVSLSVCYIFFESKNWKNNIIKFLVFCIGFYFIFQFFVDYVPGLNNLIEKTDNLKEGDEGVLNGRDVLWGLAIDMFNNNPIFGYGFGGYALVSEKMGIFTTSAHNYYLQILSELGIVGLILYVSAFIHSIIFTCQVIFRSKKNSQISYSHVLCLKLSFEIQLYILIYNFTSTGLMYYTIMIPYFLACSVPCVIHLKYLANENRYFNIH